MCTFVGFVLFPIEKTCLIDDKHGDDQAGWSGGLGQVRCDAAMLVCVGRGGGVQACQGFKVLEQVWVMVRGVAVWLSGRGCSSLQDDDAWLKQAEQVGQGAKMDLRGALGQRWARQKAANKEPGGDKQT